MTEPEMTYQILQGDCLEVLKTLESESMQTCVTSPPYFGLRNYGTADWTGGDADCEHKGRKPSTIEKSQQSSTLGGSKETVHAAHNFGSVCGYCGAVRIDKQIGLEETPALYVAKMVEVFEEVRRVLRPDGTLWLNLGDSYAGSWGAMSYPGDSIAARRFGGDNAENVGRPVNSRLSGHLKAKDLIGIPWRVAFALQEAGWWLRQDIIWCLSGGTYVYAKTQKGVMPITIKDLARLDPTTVELWNGEKWTQLLGVSKSPRKGDEIEIVLRSGERISSTPTHRFPTQCGLLAASELQKGDVLKRCQLADEGIDSEGIPPDTAWFLGLYLAEGSISGNGRTIQIAGHVKENDRLDMVRKVAAFYGGTVTFTDSGNKRDIRVYSPTLLAIIREYISGRTAHNKGLSNRCWQRTNRWLQHLLHGYLHGDGHWDEKNDRWRLGFCRNYNLERDLRLLASRLGFRLTLNLSQSKMGERSFPSFRGELRFDEAEHHNRKDMNEIVDIRKARCREVYDLGVADEPHLFALASGILTHNSKPNPMPESVTDRCTKAHEYIFLLTKNAKYFYDSGSIAEPSLHFATDPRAGAGNIQYLNGKRDGQNGNGQHSFVTVNETRNKRSVWTVTTRSFKDAHFATFPPKLIEPCILAGSREGDLVLDPFNGAGTTGLVSLQHRRRYLGIELNPDYIAITEKRLRDVQVNLF